MTETIDYATPGPLTTIDAAGLPHEPVALCHLVHDLVIQPHDAQGLGVPQERFAENQLRPAGAIVGALLALDPAPLTTARPPERRVIGTCRHFAVLATALLRHRGIEARARCGFATYFQPGQGLDHWVTEYRQGGRWIRIDSEILGGTLVQRPDDLAEGEFLTGGEAWSAFRAGRIDPARFGVYGTENWGPAEIRGNAVRDLAALNKVEMLPWDEWGRMTASYEGRTGLEYDALMDTIAAVTADGDPRAVAALYRVEDLAIQSFN
ncbi:transglutaminase-like domain-containing protein [Paractinoplanes atraurantiacus]|uniref:Transglutaminase-like superfamily protein n=1 Tax=Paractinoplanes atraurantiacus TaxID=1036182 RepID=A0A285KM43_9ACTN|nr:transglutaminase-like domain-containing protein [Actinoplanes atraurantiacus]SNY73685.1 Transglutaminase-like superfamily protein [Actinoplanes atraurantiacus]